jgi:hypothetical protein
VDVVPLTQTVQVFFRDPAGVGVELNFARPDPDRNGPDRTGMS